MGVLDVLRAAIPYAAAARAGYLQGQEQREDEQRARARQSMLDQMKQAVDQSTVDENKARAQYYRNMGVPVTWKVGADGTLVPVPSKINPDGTTGAAGTTGPLATIKAALTPEAAGPGATDLPIGATGDVFASPGPASSAGAPSFEIGKSSGIKVRTPQPAGPHIIKPNYVNPLSGNVEDVYSDGNRKVIRPATADELAKARRVPGSGGSGGSGSPGAEVRTEAQRHALAQKLATEAITAAQGDPIKAMEFVEQQPDKMALARIAKVTRGDYYAAAQQWKRQHTKDVDAHASVTDRLMTDSTSSAGLDAIGRSKPGAPIAPSGPPRNAPGLDRGAVPTAETRGEGGPAAPPAAKLPAVRRTQMQAELDHAQQQLNNILANPTLKPEIRSQAQAAYDAKRAAIIAKYGGGP